VNLNEAEALSLSRAIHHFKKYDVDKNGYIDKNEFTALYGDLTSAGYGFSNEEECLSEMDQSGEGKVFLNNYIFFLITHGLLNISTVEV
jgi:Ca2+-binding EF-hand superfamily protein